MAGFTPQSVRDVLAAIDLAADSVFLPAVTAVRETVTAAAGGVGVRGRPDP